jgi:hypothetical protein
MIVHAPCSVHDLHCSKSIAYARWNFNPFSPVWCKMGGHFVIGTPSRAEDAVRFRDTPAGERQRDVLRQLERDSKRKRVEIVAELYAEIAVQHDQYRRYLRGDTPLRWDQIGAFARALRTTQSALSRALGLLDDEGVDTRTLREILHGRIPEADIERFAVEHEGKPLADQQAAAHGILRLAALQRERTRSAS